MLGVQGEHEALGLEGLGKPPGQCGIAAGVEKQAECGPAHMDGGIPGLGERVAEEAKWFQGLSPGSVGGNTGGIDRRWVDLANRGSLWYQEWAAFMENEEA